jgi:hypothetical protein
MDRGVERRLNVIQLDSEFLPNVTNNFEEKIFERDEGFLDKLKGEFKFALLKVLFEYSKIFAETGKIANIPKEWKDETTATINSNDTFKEWFMDTFKEGSDLKCSKMEVDEALKEYKQKKMNLKDFKDALKKMKSKAYYDDQKMMNKKKGVFMGIEIIKPEFNELE